MILWGTVVNAAAIIVGGLLGCLLPNIREGYRATVMQGLGLAICILGISMALKSEQFLIVVVSLVAGGLIGEWTGLEEKLNRLGQWLQKSVGSRGQGDIGKGFVAATLVYCVGAMAILGALDSGIKLNHDILYTKSMLDGFTAIIFASTLGVGVIFSAVPVFLYQGTMAMASSLIYGLVSPSALESMISEVTAVGGILIIGIGINILEVKKINVANLLPSIIVAAVTAVIVHQFF